MINEKLLQARERLGLSKADAARALDLHYNTYDKWERGERNPPAIALAAVEMLLFMQNEGILAQWLNQKINTEK